ncbi:unnamed protein product, partial [Laminaria digitata]
EKRGWRRLEDDGIALGIGGVGGPPEVGLTSKTKGRFASQVNLNGQMLSARNRQTLAECPIRSVQELALMAPRLDKPNSLTGWWPPSTINKMRHLTLAGIDSCVKLKRLQLAAEAAAAADTPAAGKSSEASPGKFVETSASARKSAENSAEKSCPKAADRRSSGDDADITTSAAPAAAAAIAAVVAAAAAAPTSSTEAAAAIASTAIASLAAEAAYSPVAATDRLPCSLVRRDFFARAALLADRVAVIKVGRESSPLPGSTTASSYFPSPSAA